MEKKAYSKAQIYQMIIADMEAGFTFAGPISWPRFDPACDDPSVYPFCDFCHSDDTMGGYTEKGPETHFWTHCYECGRNSWNIEFDPPELPASDDIPF